MDSSAVILGFTGPIGSGCSFIAEGLSKQYQGFKYFRVSDLIREILEAEGVKDPSVDQMQTRGNELRRQHHEGYLVEERLRKIQQNPAYNSVNEIILDGIKNRGEVDYLRSFANFYLFSVHADKSNRMNRLVGRTLKSKNEFESIDKRDELENESFGQQVKECDYHSDIIILNNEEIREFPLSIKKDFLSTIYDRYVSRMLELRKRDPSPEYRPTVDEMAMTSAYVLSKMSSCMKRKVGCVVVDSRGMNNTGAVQNGQEISSMPYIISTGFNEVPLGSKPCMFDYGMCYRDHLQQEHAQKLLHCPYCGEKIQPSVECYHCKKTFNEYLKMCPDCHKELSPKVKCTGCHKNVFKEYLPGAKLTPGKLLDVCRALHAEENALLALVKISGNSAENYVLYTTTQPCNLCANKIVASGIKRIVFAEPYYMQSSADILERGGVEAKRFKGVKSSAFFKLYQ